MCNRSPTSTRFSKGSTPLRRGSTKGVASTDIRHVRGAISDQCCKRAPSWLDKCSENGGQGVQNAHRCKNCVKNCAFWCPHLSRPHLALLERDKPRASSRHIPDAFPTQSRHIPDTVPTQSRHTPDAHSSHSLPTWAKASQDPWCLSSRLHHFFSGTPTWSQHWHRFPLCSRYPFWWVGLALHLLSPPSLWEMSHGLAESRRNVLAPRDATIQLWSLHGLMKPVVWPGKEQRQAQPTHKDSATWGPSFFWSTCTVALSCRCWLCGLSFAN